MLGVEKTPDGPVVALPLEAKGLPADLQLQAEALRVSGAADEVRTLPQHVEILFLAGQRPILAGKLAYYADPEFRGLFDPIER